DRVVLLPNETAPTEVQIHGVFLTFSGQGPVGGAWGIPGYLPAQEGYMYFSCPAGKEATCRAEWNDLKLSIGMGCRGFGALNEPPGTVRSDAVCPTAPDNFPMAMGVFGGFLPCQELDKFVVTDAGVKECIAPATDAGSAGSTDATSGSAGGGGNGT